MIQTIWSCYIAMIQTIWASGPVTPDPGSGKIPVSGEILVSSKIPVPGKTTVSGKISPDIYWIINI